MKLYSSYIKDFLIDELRRTDRMLDSYSKELQLLPKGKVYIKKIGNQQYALRSYRDGEKVVSKYMGNINMLDMNEIQRQSDNRKNLENIIRNLKLEKKGPGKNIKMTQRQEELFLANNQKL